MAIFQKNFYNFETRIWLTFVKKIFFHLPMQKKQNWKSQNFKFKYTCCNPSKPTLFLLHADPYLCTPSAYNNIWDKAFKNRLSKICGRQPLKNLADHIPSNFFKRLSPQVSLDPFLNTVSNLWEIRCNFLEST